MRAPDRRSLLSGLASLPLAGGLFAPPALAAVSEAEARKARSIARLKAEGVPFIDWLPMIEDSSQARPPGADAVARRFCALMLMTHKALADDAAATRTVREAFGDRVVFSPDELTFMDAAAPGQQEVVQASWLCEAAVPMAWALGRLDRLDRPEKAVDVDVLAALIMDDDGKALIAGARLRPIGEILDEADLIFRYHWAVRQAGLDGKEAPAGLNADVVPERHRGLNWLIGYAADWDEVTTDT